MIIQSSKPRKQRKFRFTAPLHVKQHFAHAHIEKALKQKLKISKRSIQISKGDTVKLVKGSKKGLTGKVIRVDLNKSKLYIDSLNKKNAKGKEFNIPININNVYIINLNLNDKLRIKKLNISKIEMEKIKKAAEQEEIKNKEIEIKEPEQKIDIEQKDTIEKQENEVKEPEQKIDINNKI